MALPPPPQLQPLKACYVSVSPTQRQRLGIVATGFQPNAEVIVTVADSTDTYTADALGNVDLRSVDAPYQRSGQRRFTITATEQDDPQLSVTATPWVTALAVHLHPRQANTSDRVRFRGRGFTRAHRPIFGHYVFHGHVRRTVRLARRPRGACGRFSVRRRQIPVRNPEPGDWTLQVDQHRRWTLNTVFARVLITVRRLIG